MNMTMTTTREPRDYQVTGANFLRTKKRAMLLDTFGLGKTYQAVLAAQKPVLVACPSYLLEQWKDEILQTFPDDTVSLCVGNRFARTLAILEQADWTLINIEMLRSYEFLQVFDYNTLIIDESHRLRGHSAQVSKAAQKLASKIPNVYMLTATPVKREVDDIFMQLAILDPKRFTSYNKFINEHCVVVTNGFGSTVVGPKDRDSLSKLLSQYSLRRSYKTAGLTKPDAIKHDIILEPSKDWYKKYKQLKENYRIEDVTFDSAPEVMRTLQHLTFDLKLEVTKSILQDNPECIFYVFYRESAHAVADYLKIPWITGEQNAQERLRIAKANKSIVATISSLSEGANLSHLNTVVFLETSYLPGDKDQGLHRVLRWSDNIRPVGVFNIMVKNTIDTTIHKLLNRRGADAMSILRAEFDS